MDLCWSIECDLLVFLGCAARLGVIPEEQPTQVLAQENHLSALGMYAYTCTVVLSIRYILLFPVLQVCHCEQPDLPTAVLVELVCGMVEYVLS